MNNKLEKAIEVREIHDRLQIGHGEARDCDWFVGPEPFKLGADEHAKLVNQGELFRQWFEITLGLCEKAYRGEKKFGWLIDLIEGETSEHVKEIHRHAHLSGLLRTPFFARPDMSALGVSVEVQVPGSGWGYQTAVSSTVEKSQWLGLVNGFQKAVEATTGSSRALSSYVLYNDPFRREVEYFCRLCKEAGMQLQMHFQTLPMLSEVKFLRRPPLEEMLSYSGGSELIEAWLHGQVVLEPGPSLLFDQKLPILFPFHQLLREFYPDSIRELFPETYLVAKGSPSTFDGQVVGWEEIARCSKSKRQFILKYAGAKKGLRAGGKAVYNLMDYSHDKVASMLEMACLDWEKNRSPWIIQKMIRQKYPIIFMDHHEVEIREAQYYALFRPMYSFPPDRPAEIISCIGVFRHDWKVHGSSDCVLLPVEV